MKRKGRALELAARAGRPADADCPRFVDAGVGPRRCPHVDRCPHHNAFGRRLGLSAREAVRATIGLELGDDCSLDVAARTRLDREPLSLTKIGLRLGVNRSRVSTSFRSAIRKVAQRLEVDERELVARVVEALKHGRS